MATKGNKQKSVEEITVPKAVKNRAQAVKELLAEVEKKMAGEGIKASVADYIRLVQLQKELDEDEPKEIKVTWVEPETKQ